MSTTNTDIVELVTVSKLTKDLRDASKTLGRDEARFLVDTYYQMQKNRIASAAQVRSITGQDNEEPHETLEFFMKQFEDLEKSIRKALHYYAMGHPVGSWMLNLKGIGPVIAAGFLAHLDIDRAPTVGHWWSFAGLDPTKEWKKGEKRPWNASLKTLCWKLGESFVKVKGKGSFYGELYDERKEYESKKNEKKEYSEQAEAILKRTPGHKQKKTYKEGKLPAGHIHARAKRYVVKMFMAHLHEIWYKEHFKKDPPKPYIIDHGGHAHHITAAEAR